MKKVVISFAALLVIAILLLPYTKHFKAYQIISTPEKEYYVKSYDVYLETGCIEFYAFDSYVDSTFVKLCNTWDVKPNPNYKP